MTKVRLLATKLSLAGLIALGAPSSSIADEPPPLGIPQLQEQLGRVLRDLSNQLGPALNDIIDRLGVLEQIDSFENYGRPKVLPNGDIIIPRLPDAPPYAPSDDENASDPPEPGVKT